MPVGRLLRLLLLSGGLSWFTSPFAADVRLEGNAAAAADIWSSFQRWIAAYDRADLDQSMSIFDPGVVFIYQGSRNQTYEDLRKGYEQDFRSRLPGTRWVPIVDEVYAEGTLGFVRATWELRVAPGGGPSQVKERNRSLDILRLSQGQWRIIRSINFPEK